MLSILYSGGKAYGDLIPADRLKAWRADMVSAVMRNAELNEVQKQVLEMLRAWASGRRF